MREREHELLLYIYIYNTLFFVLKNYKLKELLASKICTQGQRLIWAKENPSSRSANKRKREREKRKEKRVKAG